MPHAVFYTADSFTDTRFAGNPAGVVFHDGGLTPFQMQTIAGELHLETAFLSPPATLDADYLVAYYTGAKRIPFCGHDTVAAAAVLVHAKRLSAPGTLRFATDAGIIPVSVSEQGDVTLTLSLPLLGPFVDAAPFCEALGISSALLHPAPVQTASVGTPFVVLGVADEDILHALQPDMARLSILQTAPGAPDGLYVWAPANRAEDGVAFHARCFSPGAGLPEDPVTGSASGAFGAYVVRHRLLPDMGQGNAAFRTEQGRAMGRMGHVSVTLECAGGEATLVRVRGRAVIISAGTLFL